MTDGLLPVPAERWADLTDADLAALRDEEEAYAALAGSVRMLLDAAIRCRTTPQETRQIATTLREQADRLLVDAKPGSLGLQVCSDGRLRDHGNPVVGRRNGFAPPLRIERDPTTASASTEFHLGAAYEGPPGHVHGGVLALILDQVLGTVPALRGRPGMTAQLSVSYLRPSPLGVLTARAWVADAAEWQTLVKGEIATRDGIVTVRAEGLFIVPTRLRDRLVGHPVGDAGDFPSPAATTHLT